MSRQNDRQKPQRSCLGCRETRDQDQLIRFVLSPDGEVLPDLETRLPGRGAYTCGTRSCLEAAVKQRQFARAFKCAVQVLAPEEMVALVDRLMRERIKGYLGLANRAGKLISGGSLVSDALRGKIKPGLVLVACDTSASIAEKIVVLAGVHGVRCVTVLTKDEIGDILGKAPRSAVAVRQGGFVGSLVTEINRYRNFLGEV